MQESTKSNFFTVAESAMQQLHGEVVAGDLSLLEGREGREGEGSCRCRCRGDDFAVQSQSTLVAFRHEGHLLQGSRL